MSTYVTSDGWVVETLEVQLFQQVQQVVTKKYRLCGSCEGEGKVVMDHDEGITYEVPCSFCEGSGRLTW